MNEKIPMKSSASDMPLPSAHPGASRVVVLLPTFNECHTVASLIKQILALGGGFSVVVVDDLSTDGTASILSQLARDCPRVIVIEREGRRGRGIAGRVGFKRALQEKPDYIVEMDADYSHDPSYIPHFIETMRNCDMVIGSRFVASGRIMGRAWYRDWLSHGAGLVCRALLSVSIKDPTSGFRAFRREVLEALNPDTLISDGPSIIEEVNLRVTQMGFCVTEVPIVFRERAAGRSKLTLGKLFDVLWMVLRLRGRRHRKEPCEAPLSTTGGMK